MPQRYRVAQGTFEIEGRTTVGVVALDGETVIFHAGICVPDPAAVSRLVKLAEDWLDIHRPDWRDPVDPKGVLYHDYHDRDDG